MLGENRSLQVDNLQAKNVKHQNFFCLCRICPSVGNKRFFYRRMSTETKRSLDRLRDQPWLIHLHLNLSKKSFLRLGRRTKNNQGLTFCALKFQCCQDLLVVFCSTSLALTSTRWFDQCIQAFPNSKKCSRLISATSRIQTNSWESRESNPGLLGEKRKCAMPPPKIYLFLSLDKFLKSCNF